MVQVRVAGVALDASGQHVILLKPIDEIPGEGILLPIWIGQLESTSILVAVERAPVPRPMAHDLMVSIIETLGADVSRIEVTRIEEGTFYAEITLATPAGRRVVDARPSDAVALASRVGAAIWVADPVMEDAGVPDVLTESDAAERMDEFKKFLDEASPEDFEG
jgi:bifunctional DNase/RNase